MPNRQLDADYRPRLRTDIVFGPLQAFRDRRACFLKDPRNGAYYRMGERERFLLQQMDGARTLNEIGERYQLRFGKRMGDASWNQIFELIEKRSLLAGSDAPDAAAAPAPHAVPDGAFTRRFKLVNPNALLDRILPWFPFVFTRFFLVAGLVLVAASEIWVLGNLNPVVQGVWTGARHAPASVWLGFFVLVIFISAVHELGHGLTLRRFGRAVDEMGVIFRYGAFFPYTKIDDVVLLENRADQLAVAFSGTFVSLLSIVPFVLVWNATVTGGPWHQIAGLMLTSYNITALLNLVPFVQLDGYHMLALYFRRPLLRSDAREYVGNWFKASVLRRPAADQAYSDSDRLLLGGYGLGAAIAAGAFTFLVVRRWYRFTVNWAGPLGSIALIAALLIIMRFGPYFVRWLRARPPAYAGEGARS